MLGAKNRISTIELKESGNTEPRFFPKDVRYTLPNHTTRVFKAGVQEVPEEYLKDSWLIAMGMSEPPSSGALPPLMRKAPIGSQAHAASIGASGVYDATYAPRQHSEYDPVAEADQADADVAAAEANLDTLRDRAAALREVSDKHVARQVELDRSRGVPANLGEGQTAEDQQSGEASDQLKGGIPRPKDGDVNPNTNRPYTKAALGKAQDEWDAAPVDGDDSEDGNDDQDQE